MESATLSATVAALDAQPPSATAVSLEAGYGANFGGDIAAFTGSLDKAAGVVGEPSPVAEAILEPFDFINREAASLAEYAESAMASGNELSPGEIVSLTARSQEFMFHAQLTANIANRTADGLSQLFRQQS